MHRVLRPAVALALVAALAACSPESGEDEAITESVDDAFATITQEALEAHLSFLADDALLGRMTGSKGYDDAADYVAKQFESLDLEPGGDDGWFQQVPFITNLINVEKSGVTVHLDSGDADLKWKDDYVTSGDPVRDETEVRAEVVYAGYGIHAPDAGYSDYEGIDVEGKIVAIFSGAPATFSHNERAYYSSSRTKADEMVRRGAVGYIAMRSRVGQERVPWDRIILNAGLRPSMNWMSQSGDVAGYYPQIEGGTLISVPTAGELFDGTLISFEDALDAADEGKTLSTPLGIEVTIKRNAKHTQITSPNVIGIIRGSDPELASEYVVFSAHLDHVGTGAEVNGDKIYNGFYDNAMGVSLLIETARAFAAMPEPPRRSILFIAVTGEERGLRGSDYFAHFPTVPVGSMVANVNLDMPLLLFPLADVIAFGAEHSSMATPVEAALKMEGFAMTPDPMPEEVIFVRSDQYSFVRQGIPAVFLVPGYNSTDPDIDGGAIVMHHRKTHYHMPSDDLTRPVDWDSALRFARANVRIGMAIAAEDERPTWNEGDFFGDLFSKN